MAQRIDALPGVQATAMAVSLPTQGSVDLPFQIDGRPFDGKDQYHGDEQWRCVSPEYFKALSHSGHARAHLRRSRHWRLDAGRGDQCGVREEILAQARTRSASRSRSARGSDRISRTPPARSSASSATSGKVGLSEDARRSLYVPVAQVPDALTKLTERRDSRVVDRRRPRDDAGAACRRSRRSSRPPVVSCPSRRFAAWTRWSPSSIAQQNFNMLLLGIFGAIALLLAAIGIYGLMSYSVEQGAHDIGVRLALGAARRDILSMVVSSGMKLALVGLTLGVMRLVLGGASPHRDAVRREADGSRDLRGRHHHARDSGFSGVLPARATRHAGGPDYRAQTGIAGGLRCRADRAAGLWLRAES